MLKWKPFIVCLSLCLIILSGCSDNPYSGIEKKDISSLIKDKITVTQLFKGSKGDWAATYYVYKNKDNVPGTRLFLKYVGKKPYPTGQFAFNYDTGEGVGAVGKFTTIFQNAPENGVYTLPGLGHREPFDPKTVIKLQVIWNDKSEYLELKLNE